MVFLHIADMHFDTNFNSLNGIEGLPEKRRLEQRKVMKKVVDYIKENKIKYLFISGDLYEQKYIRKSTIEYINRLFTEIPETKIFITPGNHDPVIKNSFYNTFDWNENVHIFKNEIEVIEDAECDIYGYGFADFYCKESGVGKIKIKNKNKMNILAIHGSLDGGSDEYREYNPMGSSDLKKIGFDYIALGHIHKRNILDKDNKSIVYPGSTVALGFDEPGPHGMVKVNLESNSVEEEFIPLDEREYKEISIDVDSCLSDDDIVEKIENIDIDDMNLYKIVLIGSRSYAIDTKNIKRLCSKENIVKIKDESTIKYDIDAIMLEPNIRGAFVRNLKNKYDNGVIDEETMNKAIEVGLEVLK